MTSADESVRQSSKRRAQRGESTKPESDLNRQIRALTPTERLEARADRQIREIADDKAYYRRRCEELQAELDQIRPENARLKEVVNSATILDLVSLVFITVGGLLLSYAAFYTEPLSHQLATVGFGVGLCGVALSLFLNIFYWLKR